VVRSFRTKRSFHQILLPIERRLENRRADAAPARSLKPGGLHRARRGGPRDTHTPAIGSFPHPPRTVDELPVDRPRSLGFALSCSSVVNPDHSDIACAVADPLLHGLVGAADLRCHRRERRLLGLAMRLSFMHQVDCALTRIRSNPGVSCRDSIFSRIGARGNSRGIQGIEKGEPLTAKHQRYSLPDRAAQRGRALLRLRRAVGASRHSDCA